MPWVKNRMTGLVHQVPSGHFSLSRPSEYHVLPEPQAEEVSSSGDESNGSGGVPEPRKTRGRR